MGMIATIFLTVSGCSTTGVIAPQTEAEQLRSRYRELSSVVIKEDNPNISAEELESQLNSEMKTLLSSLKKSLPWSTLLDEADRTATDSELAKEYEENTKNQSPEETIKQIRGTLVDFGLEVPKVALLLLNRHDANEKLTEQDIIILQDTILSKLMNELS